MTKSQIDREDVRAALKEFADENGIEAAHDLMGGFEISNLPEEKFSSVITAARGRGRGRGRGGIETNDGLTATQRGLNAAARNFYNAKGRGVREHDEI